MEAAGTARDQFKPIRIGENLLVSYNGGDCIVMYFLTVENLGEL